MNILVRLPNWLGDMVMSSGFVHVLREHYPGAVIDLVVKKGFEELLERFPPHDRHFIFSKQEYPGLKGAWQFGKMLAAQKKYDLFFCLPDSFSSAVMGFASGARKRIGYRKEGRGFLLTSAFVKIKDQHRVVEYVDLLRQFTGVNLPDPLIQLYSAGKAKRETVIININSEASSRRIPEKKAVSIIDAVRAAIPNQIILAGSKKEKQFVDVVFGQLKNKDAIHNGAGETSIRQLADLFEKAAVVLSTDSGPAHLANACGAHTVVLHGADDERNTAPYNRSNRTDIRLGKLPCEPCVRNTCKIYGVPECLLQLDVSIITKAVQEALKKQASHDGF